MNISEKQFNKAQKSFNKLSLSEKKKNVMLQSIYSSTNTVRTETFVKSTYAHLFTFKKMATVFAILLFLVSSGTTYASYESLPSQKLYSFKVNVIEPTERFFGMNPEVQLKRRIREVEKLQADQVWSKETQESSKEAFDKTLVYISSDTNIATASYFSIFSEEKEEVEMDNAIPIEITTEIKEEIEIDIPEIIIKEDAIIDTNLEINIPEIPVVEEVLEVENDLENETIKIDIVENNQSVDISL